MVLKSTHVDANCLYQVNEMQWRKSEVEQLPSGKISLLSEFSIAEQQETLERFVAKFDFTVYVQRCISKNEFVYWEVFCDFCYLDALGNEIKQQSVFDYLMWPQFNFEPPQLLLFDMDSTFIEIEVIDELAKCHGVGEQVAAVTESAMQGKLDFSQSLISRVACLRGLSTAAIEKIAGSLPISEGVPELVSKASINDCNVAIVSGGFTPFVEKLKQQMNLYQVHANRLKIEKGRLLGEVEGDIVDAQAKADFLNHLCHQLGLSSQQVMAIGDGANDLLMMHEAGINLAYRAKPAVVAQAKGRLDNCHLGRLSDIFNW